MKRILKLIVTIVYWISIISIPISIVCKYVPTSKFWPTAFITYSLPLWLILLFLSVLFRKKRKGWKLAFVFIIIGLYGLRNNYAFNKKNDEKGDFSVLNYNIRLFDYYNWLQRETWDNWEPRSDDGAILDSIYTFLGNQNTDVICFQEYFNQRSGDYRTEKTIKKRLGYKYVHKKISFSEKFDEYGMATFSKYPIIRKKEYGFGNRLNNGILATDIKINNDTIRIINVHLLSYQFGKADHKYLKKLKENLLIESDLKKSKSIFDKLKKGGAKRSIQLNKLLTIISNSKYPVILCGDFNEIPNSYLYKKISDLLCDAFIDKGFGIGNTQIEYGVLRIDYSFHSEEFETNAFSIPKVELSDHYPVKVNYSIKK